MNEARSRRDTYILILHNRPYPESLLCVLASLQMAVRAGAVAEEAVAIWVLVDKAAPGLADSIARSTDLTVEVVELPWLLSLRVRLTQRLLGQRRVPILKRLAERRLRWQSTYWPKVHNAVTAATRLGAEIIVKCDDDIVLSPAAWHLLTARANHEMQVADAAVVTPALTSGIPTWMDFANSFLTEKERSSLLHDLGGTKFPAQVWGVDYSAVRSAQDSPAWNEDAHQSALRQLNHYYKGYHPIRFDAAACAWLAEVVLTRLSQFLAYPRNTLSSTRLSTSYLCNGVFAIRASEYLRVLDDCRRFRDPFDEVPLNLWLAELGMPYVIGTECLGVHFMYNSAYEASGVFKGQERDGRDLEEIVAAEFLRVLSPRVDNIQEE